MSSKPFIPDAVFCCLVVEAVAAEIKIPADQLKQATLPRPMAERWTLGRLLAITVAYELGEDLSFPPMAELLGIPPTSLPTLAKEGLKRRQGKDMFRDQFERALKAVKARMAIPAAAA